MLRHVYRLILLVFSIVFLCMSQTVSSANSDLQLLDTQIFGKSSREAIVLLQPKAEGAVVPETVMVDIDKDRYFAATVNYPKTVSLEQTRQYLNKLYKKWEKPSFASDPTMGIWRNEEEQFAIQLTEDEENITVIYIKFSC